MARAVKKKANKKRNNKRKATGYRGFLQSVFPNPQAEKAAFWLTFPTVLVTVVALAIIGYMALISRDLPSLQQIENPEFDLATVAYTADGVELARFGLQNRTWVYYDDISEHVINALVSVEDHRFEAHWGMDLFRTFSAVTQSILGELGLPFDRQGGSTITQQLARNLYNEQIGFEVSVPRKLKEMVTAIRLEYKYAKPEIIEMYLNTVPFLHNAYGIEAASRTYFGKSSSELDVLESAALVGMLKGTYRYNPYINPEQSRNRRNIVLRRMVALNNLEPEFYETYRDTLTATKFRDADVTNSRAPYFAEQVRQWLSNWGKEQGIDVYSSGLTVLTTLDSRVQQEAQRAVTNTMDELQAVVNCEWSAARSPRLTYGEEIPLYLEDDCHLDSENHFAWFWERNPDLLEQFIQESARFRSMVSTGAGRNEALQSLMQNNSFLDSLKTTKTRLENGLVAINPANRHVKAWVGGRDLALDWYDHVSVARRQPGSTFKPFVYSLAITSGYSPNDTTYKDALFRYLDPFTGDVWSPKNSGGDMTGRAMPLREGLARSKNTVSGQLIIDLKPENVVRLAHNMGIKSPLEAVPSLALGTSDVSLLEMTNAYTTIATLGEQADPVMVTKVYDNDGNQLYPEDGDAPLVREALNEHDATVIIDMLRDVINQSYGTGARIRWQYFQDGYDFAGKTGTTQEGADGWFILMHKELVTGSWVGFNDRRMAFRSSFWGQGGHNALFVVGDFISRINADSLIALSIEERFPDPPRSDQGLSRGINSGQRTVW